MGETADLYERDFALWSAEQAGALRAAALGGANLPVDWENVAEEIDSLGRSQRTELGSRIATIIEHLVKLEFSPADRPRPGWMDTVRRERRHLERLLADSPSLRRDLPTIIEAERMAASRFAQNALERHGESQAALMAKLADREYAVGEIVDDLWPTWREYPDGRQG